MCRGWRTKAARVNEVYIYCRENRRKMAKMEEIVRKLKKTRVKNRKKVIKRTNKVYIT